VIRTGDRPAETTAHPGTGPPERTSRAAALTSRLACRLAVSVAGSSVNLPSWPALAPVNGLIPAAAAR
jgi:hypothetical protein